MTLVCLLVLCALLTLMNSVYSYELATHGAMSQKVYDRILVQENPKLLDRLGIEYLKDDLGDIYYDISGTTIYERDAYRFEQIIIENNLDFLGVKHRSIAGWFLRGAIREDDIPSSFPFFGKNPQDDPYDATQGRIARVFRHFYDPYNDSGLSLAKPIPIEGITLFPKAPDWAIGATNSAVNENLPENNRRNHFTIFDARESMYRALTGVDKSGNNAIAPGGVVPSTLAEAEQVRKAYWATTFRALGDVVHLMQDMGQPQKINNMNPVTADQYRRT